ncbi:RDD family protein [Arthrobacter sp. CG_A4]|uniref:RDD family protein n=1 Tax=Arthrobacter sp. CG_A4 TaxID=3071706 RepID=UPI002DFAF2E5|nr:asparagine N-glycosylation enzyme membrane subunit Stt3 [Arthrobacter sp. CG_A4]
MNQHPWNRLAAWLVDWLLVLGWLAITAAVAVPLFLSSYTGGLSVLALNIVATLVVVVPVTVGMAVLESSARKASIGKRARRLIVVTIYNPQPRIQNTGARPQRP